MCSQLWWRPLLVLAVFNWDVPTHLNLLLLSSGSKPGLKGALAHCVLHALHLLRDFTGWPGDILAIFLKLDCARRPEHCLTDDFLDLGLLHLFLNSDHFQPTASW